MWARFYTFNTSLNPNMASLNFILQGTKNPAVIYIRLRDGRKLDIKAKTNYHINPEDWDEKEQRPLKKLLKNIDFANLDTDLSRFKNSLLTEYNKCKGIKPIDSKWLNEFVNPVEVESKYPLNLVSYIDTYIEFKKNDVKESTIKKCRVIKELLIRYEKHIKSVLLISDVNQDFKLKFETYCGQVGYSKNTTAKNLTYVKAFCNHAKGNGLATNYQLDGLKIKYTKPKHIYLNEEEIAKIENLKDQDLTDGLVNAKYWLLISCYCGQRVSDFMRFQKSMIRYEKNRKGIPKPLLEFTQVKTGKIMTIPLHSKILEILKKYNGEFPKKISDQRYNDHIKNVCKAAGINELTLGKLFNPKTKLQEEKLYEKHLLVSSHIGRRSFATNNYGKIPTTFLMQMTGHTTESMFLTYIGKSNKDLAMEMTDYF
jgi:integrase